VLCDWLIVAVQSAGAVGEGSALESWLAEAKEKLARVTEEVESSIPATTAGLSVHIHPKLSLALALHSNPINW
jgi:hypothetical protein